MPIQGVYIVPHGSVLVCPESLPDYLSKTLKITSAMSLISDEIYNLNPDLIVMTTPHGISLLNSFGVYCGYEASGTAEWQGKYTEFGVNLEIDRGEALDLISFIKKRNNAFPIEGIVSFIETIPISLRWSEVVPSYIILDRWKKHAIDKTEYSQPKKQVPKFMIISIPRSRLDLSEGVLDKSIEFGKLLAEFFMKNEKKVVFLQSGDLAHSHEITTGKLKNEPQPYPIQKDAFSKFDALLEEWAKDPLKNSKLLHQIAQDLEKYLSCGYITFTTMQGILEFLDQEKKKILSEVLCNEFPTYFGMMVSRHLIE